MLLQFGGASGQGFIGPDRVKEAHLELAKHGRFEGGVYFRDSTQGRRNFDAYEAIWLQVKGGDLSYAPPVYKTPIVMRPEALPWRPGSEEGVSLKEVGVFPHRGLRMNGWRIESGAGHQVPATGALRFLFVTDGGGTIGSEELRRWSAVRLHGDEAANLRASSRVELVELSVRSVSNSDDKRDPQPMRRRPASISRF